MNELNKIHKIIFDAIDVLNEGLDIEKRISKSNDTVLYGTNSRLDSFGLVNLIITVEEKIQDETGVALNLADEKALSRKSSPFLTVGTLSAYIEELLKNT
ncbi:MAG: acyl carrier protein [Bacteroidetes bacterium]|nr:acyl carrier protein [Bacteroidota bacterium]